MRKAVSKTADHVLIVGQRPKGKLGFGTDLSDHLNGRLDGILGARLALGLDESIGPADYGFEAVRKSLSAARMGGYKG